MPVDRANLDREGFEAWNADDPTGPDAGKHVVLIAHRRGRNEMTGLQISDKIAQVFTSNDDDKCVRVQKFYDRGTAMQVAGLE